MKLTMEKDKFFILKKNSGQWLTLFIKLCFLLAMSMPMQYIISSNISASSTISDSSDSLANTLTKKYSGTPFRQKISEIAVRYIGMPYRFGGDPDHSGTADNSHLLCSIYDKAARSAGMKFIGYMPMRSLLRNTVRVSRDELENGDLIVLNEGHAALIYNLKSPDDFDLLYASLKRQEVISFNSKNIVFEAYWLKYLKGFYRLSKWMFKKAD